MLLSEAIALIGSAGGFDTSIAQTSDTQIRSWISTMVQEAVAEAKWLRQIRQLGPTVASQAEYAVDGDVIQVRTLRVNGGRPWARSNLEDLWIAESQPGAAQLSGGAPGAFAPSWETEAAQDVDDVPRNVRLWPAPTSAGQTIEAMCVVDHKVIDAGTSAGYVLQVPNDLVRKIAVDGPIGYGLTTVSERADLAAPYLARYEDGKALLKRRANSQIGSGPRTARVWRGYR